MIVFWTLAAAMLLLGSGLVIRPLLARQYPLISGREQKNIEIARERLRLLEDERAAKTIDQHQFDQSRLEIEQILANDLGSDSGNKVFAATRSSIGTAVMVGLAVPLITILMYGFLGNTEGLDVRRMRENATTERSANGQQIPSVNDMVNRLAERLKANPEDPNGWRLLARSYLVMKRYPDAIEALRKARGLVGDDPDVLVELADTIAAAQNGSFEGQPSELLATVLVKTPQHPGGLWLAGRSALGKKDLPLALQYWRKLEAVLPEDAEGAESVRLAIARVEGAIGRATTPMQQIPVNQSEQVQVARSDNEVIGLPETEITVKVALDQALSSSVDLEDTVFIYAQALSGPPMPLAVSRKKVRDLPVQVTLNESMAMMPAMSLSKFSEVRVIARISKTGNAIPQPGDFKGQIEPVSVDENALVDILITEKIR